MKTYMNYLGIIVLLAFEILTVSKLSAFGLENLFALWAGVFGVLLYRQFINYSRVHNVHETPGGMISGAYYDPTPAILETEKITRLEKYKRAALKNGMLKLTYLTLTLANVAMSYYYLKF